MNDLFDISYDERDVFDLMIKERLSRVILSKTYGVRASFGDGIGSSKAPIFDIPFYDISRRSGDFDVLVHDIEFAASDLWQIFDAYCIPLYPLVMLFLHISDVYLPCAGEISAKMMDELIGGAESLSYAHCQEGFYGEDEDFLYAFLKGYIRYLNGDSDGAFKIGAFLDACTAVAAEFCPGDDTSLDYAADNIAFIMEGIGSVMQGGTDARLIAYSSREVFLYGRYRDLLPLDIRRMADLCISIFKEPSISEKVSVSCDDYDGRCIVLVSEHLDALSCLNLFAGEKELLDYAYSATRCFNPYFEAAICWLDKNLKTLRMKYCKE